MRLPTDRAVIALERAEAGTRYGNRGLNEQFLGRMRRYGYLDADYRRTSALERLRLVYDTQGLALFLGAGVSKASGIPDWRSLLDSLLADMKRSAPRSAGKVRSRSPSTVLEAEARLPLVSQFDLVAHDCHGPDRTREFTDRLRACLYGERRFAAVRKLANAIPEDNKKKTQHDWRPLLAALQRNATLAALGDLLVRVENGQLEVNPKIHAVLTTNVDNLLQLYTMSVARGARLLDTINHPGADANPGRTSVYHLHGWLDMRDARRAPVAKPPLVFRESEYFDAIASPNGFANETAQYFFQRRNVLFVGTSLEDLNVRRWLYNAFEERLLALQRLYEDRYRGYAGARAEAYAASIRHFWLKREGDLPKPRLTIQRFIEDAMRHLGVQVVWYRDHAQVAQWLRALDPGTEV